MMKPKHLLPAVALACLSLTVTPGRAAALSDGCTMISSDVGISIEECGWSTGDSFGASYALYNNSDAAITAFAVSTTAPPTAQPWKELMEWQAQYVTEQAWNDAPTLRGVGLFATVFGPAEHAAFLFWNGTRGDDGLPATITDTEALAAQQLHAGYFGFNGGYPASEFVAFAGTTGGASGGLNDLTPLGGSFSSPVPEPASMALMLAGLGVVGRVTRRRRT